MSSIPINKTRSELSSSGSATGTIRNKVALKPGHSLLDWIRLGCSGKDLTGVGGVYQTVTVDELARHNKRDDAWMAIKGQVYNVTHYLDFHPGGPDELMKGVGKDATKLFNEVHAWVNVQSMLQKCLVGRLKPSKGDSRIFGAKENLSSLLFSKLLNPPNKKENGAVENGTVTNGDTGSPKPSGFLPLIDWFQKPESITLLIYTKRPGIGDSVPYVRVMLREEHKVEVKLRIVKSGIFNSFSLPIPFKGAILWPCSVKLTPDIGRIEIVFIKKYPQIWQDMINPKLISPTDIISKPVQECKERGGGDNLSEASYSVTEVKYEPYTVMEILPVNHDTKLFILKHVNDVCDLIPIGYHVLLQASIDGVTIERNYTPVVPAIHSDFWPPCIECKSEHKGPFPSEVDGNWLSLLIKSTEGGTLSPWLCNGGLSVGGTLLISECIAPGRTNEHLLPPPPFHMGQSPILNRSSKDSMELLLLAAGTGLTPMVRVILWGLQIPANQCKKVTLIFFNKTEKDIIWRDQLEKLSSDCSRFSVRYVLSNAEAGWKGEQGIIQHDLIQPYFLKLEGDSDVELSSSTQVYTCICGPIPFSRAAEKILLDLGIDSKCYFTFLG